MTANCTYTQVKQIINTSISDSDITALIALSDAEISDRGLTGLSASALQEISMLLTAEKIVLRDPKKRAAYYTIEAGLNDNVKFPLLRITVLLLKGTLAQLKLPKVYRL